MLIPRFFTGFSVLAVLIALEFKYTLLVVKHHRRAIMIGLGNPGEPSMDTIRKTQ